MERYRSNRPILNYDLPYLTRYHPRLYFILQVTKQEMHRDTTKASYSRLYWVPMYAFFQIN